jgi:hypothetical protein
MIELPSPGAHLSRFFGLLAHPAPAGNSPSRRKIYRILFHFEHPMFTSASN